MLHDPNCPKFLESHLKKLRDAWEDTLEKAQQRKQALSGGRAKAIIGLIVLVIESRKGFDNLTCKRIEYRIIYLERI